MAENTQQITHIITEKQDIIDAINAQTIIKTLEVYRDDEILPEDARSIDIHLADLCCRILAAIGEMPDTQSTEQPAPGPSTEQEITPPSPEDLAEPPGAPISGDAPALFNESNECITTTVQQQAPTGPDVDDAAGSPGRGGEPAAPANTHREPEATAENNAEGRTAKDDTGSGGPVSAGIERHPIAELIEAWKTEHNASNMELQRQSGVSNGLIGMILNGKTLKVSPATRKKLSKVIKRKKKRVAAAPEPPPTNGSAKPNGEGPGNFIKMKTLAWMYREKLGTKTAAEKLMIKESEVRSICDGVMPGKNTLILLGRYIPDIHNNLHDLKAAVENGAAG